MDKVSGRELFLTTTTKRSFSAQDARRRNLTVLTGLSKRKTEMTAKNFNEPIECIRDFAIILMHFII